MNQREPHGLTAAVVAAASLALLTAGCGDGSDSGTGPEDGPSTTPVSASVTGSGGIEAPEFGAPSFTRRVLDAAGNVLDIDRIRIVLAQPRVKPSGVASCGDGECVDVDGGPVLIDLPLAGSLLTLGTVELENGTWDGLEVEIRRPTVGEDDQFIQDHPQFEGVSVRMEGTFNDQSVEFATDVEGTFLLDLDPALELDEAQNSGNATLVVDFSDWFRADDGNLVDPTTAVSGGANEGLVEGRIMNSLRAFQDNDENGNPGEG